MKLTRRDFARLSAFGTVALLSESFLCYPFSATGKPLSLKASVPGGKTFLEDAFKNPTREGLPVNSQIGTFWFWVNSVTKEGIRRDLEEIKRVGIRRVILGMTKSHSGTIETGGVVFLSPQWLALFRYALDEAERLGIKVSAVMSNGWYQGAPWVTPAMGAQMLVWSETNLSGPMQFSGTLPEPDKFRKGRHNARIDKKAKGHFKRIALMAFRQNKNGELLKDTIVRLDGMLQADGKLEWSVPEGNWSIFRFAHVPNFVAMKQDSPGFTGLQIDHLSAKTIQLFFNKVGLPILEAAGPHVGKTLDFFHEDSVELGHFDWTEEFPQQFEKRRKYNLIPWLPVLAGRKFQNEETDRIVNDFTETVDELLADEHYCTFRQLCHQHGIKLETEGGDVHSSLRVKGTTDLPMGEFWNVSADRSDASTGNFLAFNPNAVIASHIYGNGRVSFEAFTSKQHWMEYPAMLKPMADEVYCRGVNHLVLHGYSYSRPETQKPGDVYFAGTHFNPGITWWKYADKFFSYLNRCQVMLTAGKPIVDILYLDGAEAQAFIRQNESRKITSLSKCDVIPGDLLLQQLNIFPGGRIGLKNGMSYAVLSVADSTINPEVLQRIVKLTKLGANVWFRKIPRKSSAWSDFPKTEKIIADSLKEIGADRAPGIYKLGKGKLILGDMPVENMLQLIGLAPAFSYNSKNGEPFLDFNQRSDGDTDIFFVANWKNASYQTHCSFRVESKQPELWNPVNGQILPCEEYQLVNGICSLTLELPAHGSMFIVFRKKPTRVQKKIPQVINTPNKKNSLDITASPWKIKFRPEREGQAQFQVSSSSLFLWNESADNRIKSFSGTATYHASFNIDRLSNTEPAKYILELGTVHDLAEVLVNGKPAGVVWTSPFSVDISECVNPGKNTLEINVVNTWHNWRIANKFTAGTHPWEKLGLSLPPEPAGLIGPVTLSLSKH